MTSTHTTPPLTPLLWISRLSKRYPRPGLWGALAHDAPAVDTASLRLDAGDVVGLIGESGSGKTTLVRAALGLVPFDEGHVELLGHRLTPGRNSIPIRLRRRAQLLVQNPDASLNPGLRVIDLLRESARLHQPDRAPSEVVEEVAASVSILNRLHAWPYELSGGEKRRVGIARLLISQPDLTVADEPTAGLDASLKSEIVDLLLEERRPQQGFLIISHDLPLVAYACQRIVVMYAGRVVEEVPVPMLGRVSHHPYTRSLLGAVGMAEPVAPVAGRPAGRGARACSFFGICPLQEDRCGMERPILRTPSDTHATNGSTHRLACLVLSSAEGSR